MKPNEPAPIGALRQLFEDKGTLSYGERINQIEHALQCATLAVRDGASQQLVIAAMLHDIGHLLHRDAAQAYEAGVDDVHEAIGARHLARAFGPAVSEPVALHVQAKRFLCAREPGYFEGLSLTSRRTLEMQGGPMTRAQAQTFEQLPYAMDAVSLRRWDDEGKQPGMPTLPLEHFLEIASGCLA